MAEMSLADRGALAPELQPDTRGPLEPTRLFAGRRFVVVGGTGFLGKVWLSLFLHRFPDVGHIYLMVRPKGEQSAEARFWADVASSEVFEPLREEMPGKAFEAFLIDKVTPVAGDVTRELLGFDERLVASMKGNVAAVVNVAGVVDFNPPLDEALEVNAFGVNNLIGLARELGAAVMHTSTCYVAGYRTGFIEEVDPRQVPFPRAEGAPGERLIAPPKGLPLDRTLDRSHWDPQNEISECLDVIEHVRHRCEDQFRQSLFLAEAKRNLERRGEPGRGSALADELAEVKRKFTQKQLIDAGMERALYWGWPNIYTYTKCIGEQVLADSGVPYTIVRPAVIESAVQFPFKGWIEGINTSAPFLFMALRGQMQFPNDHDVRLDIIPVDMVASGMLAALAELVAGDQEPVYQYGSTDTNGCRMSRFMELTGLYKRKRWQDGGDNGNPVVNAILARFEPIHLSKAEYQRHGPHALARAARGVSDVLDKASVGPIAQWLKPASRALRKAARQEDKIGDIMDLFLPFTAECEWVFSCANTRRAMARMSEQERARFVWAPEAIDWRQWMFDVHLPGIEKWAVPLMEDRLKRETKALRRYDTLLDVLDEMAERHGHSVALRLLTDEGLTRTTYIEWREASASVAGRLLAEGVEPGDRVLLSGDNRPAWAIAYFGILRAGAIAVPVDPKLSGEQLANIIRSADLRVALWGEEVAREGGQRARQLVESLCVLDLDVVVQDDRSLPVPDIKVAPRDLASIIYTSGTTGDPKGVMLTHENFTSLLSAITPLFKLGPRDNVLSVLPLHHTFEFSCGLLLAMSCGATIHYIGELTPERLGEGLTKGRISAMVGVPALWQMLERRIVNEAHSRGPMQAQMFDWALELNRLLGKSAGIDAGKLFFGTVHDKLGGRVRYLISGGSALPKSTAKTFAGLGLHLSEGYGLTEAAPVLTVAKARPGSRAGQVGKAIPGVEIKIGNADKDGIGEVLARGPNVMHGYYGNRDATHAVIDADGWLRTGDLGKLDRRGRLVLSGRSKDVIVSASGENVYPDDVEEMLGAVEHIEELAILGVVQGDTGTAGEVVACVARPAESDEGRAAVHARAMRSLREACKKLPRHCQPAIIKLYDAELPKTATRKIKRAAVKVILERLLQASAAPSLQAGKAGGTLGKIQHVVAALSGRKAESLTAEMSLADLGFDSLMSMELVTALEAQLGRSLDPEQYTRADTIGDLVRLAGADHVLKVAVIEDDDAPEEPIELPEPVVRGAKQVLTAMQMGFYGKVMRPTVYGRAFIPHNRNTIVVSNHASHLDMGFVKYALGDYGQEVVSLAAQDYFFRGRWRRTYFDQLTNLQAFDRKTHLRQALREACDTIRAGRTVVLFPEGTRSTDGDVHAFKSTLGHLALTCGVDILPVYLDGTYESWPKGTRLPTRRKIAAHIGPPLQIEHLRRLTAGMKFAAACRAAAKLARQAVVALRRGDVLDLSQYGSLDEALGQVKEHPLVALFRELEGRFNGAKVSEPVTFYFSLGGEAEAKWTVRMTPDGCEIIQGKPDGLSADCVLKTSSDIFTKMIREAYMPSPVEVMQGLVKSNNVALLGAFREAFELS